MGTPNKRATRWDKGGAPKEEVRRSCRSIGRTIATLTTTIGTSGSHRTVVEAANQGPGGAEGERGEGPPKGHQDLAVYLRRNSSSNSNGNLLSGKFWRSSHCCCCCCRYSLVQSVGGSVCLSVSLSLSRLLAWFFGGSVGRSTSSFNYPSPFAAASAAAAGPATTTMVAASCSLASKLSAAVVGADSSLGFWHFQNCPDNGPALISLFYVPLQAPRLRPKCVFMCVCVLCGTTMTTSTTTTTTTATRTKPLSSRWSHSADDCP